MSCNTGGSHSGLSFSYSPLFSIAVFEHLISFGTYIHCISTCPSTFSSACHLPPNCFLAHTPTLHGKQPCRSFHNSDGIFGLPAMPAAVKDSRQPIHQRPLVLALDHGKR